MRRFINRGAALAQIKAFEMNFSIRQWRELFVVDTVIKGSVAFGGAILALLGTVILGDLKAVMLFIAIGASISCFHLLGLFFRLWDCRAAQGSNSEVAVTEIPACFGRCQRPVRFRLHGSHAGLYKACKSWNGQSARWPNGHWAFLFFRGALQSCTPAVLVNRLK
jgi:hypothetical protein